NQARNANPLHRPVEAECFDESFLLASEINLVPQQAADFLEGIREQGRGESVAVMLIAEVLGQSLQVVHILGKRLGDVRLPNFENAMFALAAGRVGAAGVDAFWVDAFWVDLFWVDPREANHRADAGFRQYGGSDLHRVFLN